MATLRFTRKRATIALAISLSILGGFAAGFMSCLDLKTNPSDNALKRQMIRPGDAPPAVRAGVLNSLRAFQTGYEMRDVHNLDPFMKSLFARDSDVLMIGDQAGTAEWVRGYTSAAQFIQRDWESWGDFRFDVDDAVVWSSGEVAWVASTGSIRSKDAERPIRFTAILTRDGDRWVFRQIQFQLDQTDPEKADVLNPHMYIRLVHMALRKITTKAGELHR
ncbi:MAG: nuclear transport factor 2 family protein [Terracidiphilus sp.]